MGWKKLEKPTYSGGYMIKENPPLYRHYWLYEDFELYQKNKYLSDEDLKTHAEMHEKELKAEKEIGLAHPNTELLHWSSYQYRNRYHRLSKHTAFFKKMDKLATLFFDSKSYSEYKLKALAAGHTEGQARYAMLYTGFRPERVYSRWPYTNILAGRQVGKSGFHVVTEALEFEKWKNFQAMHAECAMDFGIWCDYEAFIEGEEDDPC